MYVLLDSGWAGELLSVPCYPGLGSTGYVCACGREDGVSQTPILVCTLEWFVYCCILASTGGKITFHLCEQHTFFRTFCSELYCICIVFVLYCIVFFVNFCWVFLPRDTCSKKATPEAILDCCVFLRWVLTRIPESHHLKRGNKELLMCMQLLSVWWVAEVPALPCISKAIPCVFLGKLFLLVKLCILFSFMHQGIHGCSGWNFYVQV